MKTPDEIKKGLKCHIVNHSCRGCPYKRDTPIIHINDLYNDAIEYIQKLEETISSMGHLNETMHNEAKKGIQELESRLAQAERERDAAVRELEIAEDCYNCKYNYACKHDGNGYRKCSECGECPCSECNSGQSQYEWRGVCTENTKEEN